MKKPSIEEWAQDCKAIGIQVRRFGYANKCMPEDEVHKQHGKTVEAIQTFANKYAMGYDSAKQIAEIVSDSVSLGLSY